MCLCLRNCLVFVSLITVFVSLPFLHIYNTPVRASLLCLSPPKSETLRLTLNLKRADFGLTSAVASMKGNGCGLWPPGYLETFAACDRQKLQKKKRTLAHGQGCHCGLTAVWHVCGVGPEEVLNRCTGTYTPNGLYRDDNSWRVRVTRIPPYLPSWNSYALHGFIGPFLFLPAKKFPCRLPTLPCYTYWHP